MNEMIMVVINSSTGGIAYAYAGNCSSKSSFGCFCCSSSSRVVVKVAIIKVVGEVVRIVVVEAVYIEILLFLLLLL